jgi:MFS family permease
MRWLSLLTTGLITGVVGAVVAAVVADRVAEYRNVSNFEGARGYLILFIFVPLGFLVGLGLGVWLARYGPVGIVGWARQQAIALGAAALLIAAAGGIVYLASDHHPKLGGKEMNLEYEVRFPAAVRLPDPLEALGLAVSLQTGTGESRGSFFHLDDARNDGGRLVVPGEVFLFATGEVRTLYVAYHSEKGATLPTQCFHVPIPARPRQEQTVWSEWVTPYSFSTVEPLSVTEQQCEVRFRVQPISGP